MTVSEAKQTQRKAGRAARKALGPEERKAANAALCAFLWQLAAVQNAQTILLYAAFGFEADLAAFAAENEEEIGFWKFVQYKFAAQWQAVKAYANKKDVQILGDIPIYVSADSVDAWVGGALFELDADGGFSWLSCKHAV